MDEKYRETCEVNQCMVWKLENGIQGMVMVYWIEYHKG